MAKPVKYSAKLRKTLDALPDKRRLKAEEERRQERYETERKAEMAERQARKERREAQEAEDIREGRVRPEAEASKGRKVDVVGGEGASLVSSIFAAALLGSLRSR